MTSHIMIVEDDPSTRRLLTFLLEREGYDVDAVESADGARETLRGARPDLVVLDLMLPGQDGIEFGRELRQRPEFHRVPVVALTARDQAIDKYEAYKAGFDAYFTKPFDPIEFIFGVRAFLRLSGPGDESTAAEIGPERFKLYPSKLKLVVDDREVSITRLETSILAYLMTRPGEVYSAEQLAENVLLEAHGRVRTVDAVHAHIRNLRTKIELDPKNPDWLKTMGRRGYYFVG